MKNTLGHFLTVTLFGESHGPEIGAVLDGIAPGIPVNEEEIARRLTQRRPQGAISTARQEADPFRLVSGVLGGYTTGAPLTCLIPNSDTRSGDYASMGDLARPSHADYAARMKYHGFEDKRGGGHFSGRLTAPLVAVGTIVRDALRGKGITLGTHIASLGCVKDRPFAYYGDDIQLLDSASFPVLDPAVATKMEAEILSAKEAGDSVGGVLECAVLGLPAGVGEPWFGGVESVLASALFAIPAVKGVEFGGGFAMCEKRGSQVNDAWRHTEEGAKTTTNYSGGIQGGITNGMPLTVRVAIKPTPTISMPQDTVDMTTGDNATLAAKGRHDPAIVHRARAVVDAVVSLCLGDLLCQRYGTDYLTQS